MDVKRIADDLFEEFLNQARTLVGLRELLSKTDDDVKKIVIGDYGLDQEDVADFQINDLFGIEVELSNRVARLSSHHWNFSWPIEVSLAITPTGGFIVRAVFTVKAKPFSVDLLAI